MPFSFQLWDLKDPFVDFGFEGKEDEDIGLEFSGKEVKEIVNVIAKILIEYVDEREIEDDFDYEVNSDSIVFETTYIYSEGSADYRGEERIVFVKVR